jgi:hypothetical protein
MSKEYIVAAERINDLADEFCEDYDLANLLRAGSSKLMKLAQKNNQTLLKISSIEIGEYQKVINE